MNALRLASRLAPRAAGKFNFVNSACPQINAAGSFYQRVL